MIYRKCLLPSTFAEVLQHGLFTSKIGSLIGLLLKFHSRQETADSCLSASSLVKVVVVSAKETTIFHTGVTLKD